MNETVRRVARGELEAFLGALRYFTRVPVPAWVGHSADGLNHAARYFPAVGLLVGGVAALVFVAAASLWPTAIAVLLAMAATVYLTGAFHEDGLCDTADGLGGGWRKEDVLRIMKDSRAGSYGVVAMVLVLLGKFAALTALPLVWVPVALVAGHTVSRFAAVTLLAAMDYARADASSKTKPLATRLGTRGLLIAGAWPLIAGGLLMAPAGWPPVLAGVLLAALVSFWLARKLQRRLGGYTGDGLGAVQQASEVAFYLGLLCSCT